MFILKCANCQQQVNVSPELAGSVVNCPVCGKGLAVPAKVAEAGDSGGAGGAGGAEWAAAAAGAAAIPAGGAARAARNFSPAWNDVTNAASGARDQFRATMNPPPGQNFGMVAPGTPPACSRLVYIVLAIFLGTLGIHNFVAGLTGRGWTQLIITIASVILTPCTFGISALGVAAMFVWSLIDIVTIKTDARGITMN
jgi:TM2 domain-containing membrane protein YozV